MNQKEIIWHKKPLYGYSNVADAWDASFPGIVLNRESFAISLQKDSSFYETIIQRLGFKDSRGNRNEFSLYFKIPLRISYKKMNNPVINSMFKCAMFPASHYEYLSIYFPELFLSGKIKYERDSLNNITNQIFSEEVIKIIACWCTNRAAFIQYNINPCNCAIPNSAKIHQEFFNDIDILLNVFIPGAECKLILTNTTGKEAFYVIKSDTNTDKEY
jgi:hypothetical protein